MIFPAATAGVLNDLDHRMAKDLAVTYFVEDEGASRRRSRRTTEEQQEQEQEQPQDFGRDESSDGEVVVGASGKAMRVIGAKDTNGSFGAEGHHVRDVIPPSPLANGV